MSDHRHAPTLISRRSRRRLQLFAGFLFATALALGGSAPLLAGARHWTPIGPSGASIRALAARGGIIYVWTEAGVLVSKDAGRHWHPSNAGLDFGGGGPFLLTVDPDRSNLLYASNGRSLNRSFDGAASWHTLPFPAVGQISQIAIAPSTPRTLYVTACATGHPGSCSIEKSVDRGATWVGNTLPFVEYGQLVVDPGDAATLYLAAERIAKSTDGGASWSIVGPASQQLRFVGALAIDPASPDTVYAAGSAAVGKSIDAGHSWKLLAAGLPQPGAGSFGNLNLSALIVDPDQPSILYTGAAGSPAGGIGVFVSTDSGATWTHISRGLPRAVFDGLAFDPATSVLYAGTYDMGVYALEPAVSAVEPADGTPPR